MTNFEVNIPIRVPLFPNADVRLVNTSKVGYRVRIVANGKVRQFHHNDEAITSDMRSYMACIVACTLLEQTRANTTFAELILRHFSATIVFKCPVIGNSVQASLTKCATAAAHSCAFMRDSSIECDFDCPARGDLSDTSSDSGDSDCSDAGDTVTSAMNTSIVVGDGEEDSEDEEKRGRVVHMEEEEEEEEEEDDEKDAIERELRELHLTHMEPLQVTDDIIRAARARCRLENFDEFDRVRVVRRCE